MLVMVAVLVGQHPSLPWLTSAARNETVHSAIFAIVIAEWGQRDV